jgi:uncharacterized protein YegP (UPF0339 family)
MIIRIKEEAMNKYKIEVLRKVGSKWYWRLKSGNGRILAHSETYVSMQQALDTATRVAKALGCSLFVGK